MKNLIRYGLQELKKNGLGSFIRRVVFYFLDSCKKAFEKEFFCKEGMVSVIIPIYDRTWELKESVESILNQTYKNFELILVTDGSPKETMDVVEGYKQNPKVKIFHYPDNTGNAVRGRNKGIKEATGEFVAFQDSDDIAQPDRLEKSIKLIKESGADIIFGGWKAMLDGSRNIEGIEDGQEFISEGFNDENLLVRNQICQSTVTAKREALLNVGGLKRNMKYREDHELWLRLMHFGYKFQHTKEVLTRIRLHSGNNELNFKDEDNKWYELMLLEYKNKGNDIYES